jgi:diguanylate cyclase (GGDEF)-like protein
LRAYVAGYLAVAAVLAAVLVRFGTQLATNRALLWPLLALVVVATDFVQMRFHSDGQSVQIDLIAVPVTVGAVYTSPWGLLLAVAAGIFVTGLVRRMPLSRLCFNVANHTVALTLARLTLGAVLRGAIPTGLQGVGAVALSCLVFELVATIGLLGAVSIAAGAPGWGYVRTVLKNSAMVFPVTAVLSILTITVMYVETWGIALLAAPAVALGLWYRSADKSRTRFANLEQLYSFTVKLSKLSDTDDIITATLEESSRTLRGRHVELRLPPSLGGLRCVRGADGAVERNFGPMTDLEQRVADQNDPVLVRKGRRDLRPDGYDLPDLMAVPVPLGDFGAAVMVVGSHEVEDETFDREDLRFCEAFAANLGTALVSSQRLDRLRIEVAAREHQALHDSLTGLGNRTLFNQWVDEALGRRRPQQRVGVMVLDLDGFKDVNDTLGHQVGDMILKEVAGRVLVGLGSERRAARLGGDEFALVISSAGSTEEIVSAAEAVLKAVSQPIAVEGLILEIRASVGVAVAPYHGWDALTLLRRADGAMYAAKTSRKGVVVYDHDIDQHARRRLTLAADLRKALDAEELEVWYQPVASLTTGDITGLEALLRWRHPEHGSISPDEFIPVAEQTGIIEPLTWWVMERALKELARWRRDGYELTMAVNVSARSIMEHTMVVRLRRLLKDIGVPPADLTLEITESLMMSDPEGSERILDELSKLGVQIAIDDFGTGYSSLSRIKRLPVNTVKIDRSFVLSMHNDGGDEAIIRATIELARSFGLKVVAEGVEVQETWDRLLELGCDLVQGYLIAPAMPADVCRRWLRGRQQPRMASIRVLRTAHGA